MAGSGFIPVRPSLFVTEDMVTVGGGQFRWSLDSELYQLPEEKELLPDRARKLMFQTYLKMNGLGFCDKITINADQMSPNEKSPFLAVAYGQSPVIFDDFFRLINFLQSQGYGLGRELDNRERADCEAFISLVKTAMLPTLEYETWINSANWKDLMEHPICSTGSAFEEKFTVTHSGAGLPSPLYRLVPYLKWARYCWQHWDLYWGTQDEVIERFESACHALSVRLGDNKMFFPSGPTALDAVVYGCVEAICSSPASTRLNQCLDKFPSLQQYCHELLLTQRKGLQVISSPSTSNLLSL